MTGTELVAGALLGVGVQELYRAIVQARANVKDFENILGELENTIKLVTPQITEIDRLNQKLDNFPKAEIRVVLQQLKKAEELVSTCSEIPTWNYYKKYKCWKRLHEMDLSLQKLFNVEIQAAQALDIKRIMAEVIETNKKLDRMNLHDQKYNASTVDSSSPKRFKMFGKWKNDERSIYIGVEFTAGKN